MILRTDLLITPFGVQRSVTRRVWVACARRFLSGKQRSNPLSFAKKVKLLSLRMITLYVNSAFTHFRTLLLSFEPHHPVVVPYSVIAI